MTKVIADITMSIDGFVTGPDPDLEHGLGHGGEPLHVWVFSDDEVDAQVLEESTERSGAVVMGRRLFDIIDGPHGWNDEVGYGAKHAGTPPFFVVTQTKPESILLALDFNIVTEELVIHLAPIVLGTGTPLFAGATRRELRQREVRVSPHATHLTYDVVA